MKNFKISIYGNILLDNIYFIDNLNVEGANNCFLKNSSVGGAGNVIRAIKEKNSDADINLISAVGNDLNGEVILKNLKENNINLIFDTSSKQTSEAIILVDTYKNATTSVVQWGACCEIQKFTEVETNWNHFLYIDTLININVEDLKKFKSPISADLCKSRLDDNEKVKILSLLPAIDFLIISEKEHYALMGESIVDSTLKKLGALLKKGCVVHTSNEIFYSNGETIFNFKFNKINKHINVLGAGDYFAANIIYFISNNHMDILSAIEMAHKETEKFLLKTIL